MLGKHTHPTPLAMRRKVWIVRRLAYSLPSDLQILDHQSDLLVAHTGCLLSVTYKDAGCSGFQIRIFRHSGSLLEFPKLNIASIGA